jgi:Protein of unknown function (DUF1194)
MTNGFRYAMTALAACLALSGAARAVEVDVELALMVDVSRSMGPVELEIQRRGYAAAIASDEVVGVILNSFTGSIAVTYVEWAGGRLQRVVIPWTIIDSREAALRVSAALSADFDYSMRRTSITGALDFARESIENNAFEGLRRVIDVSGDGPNNDGGLVTEARDRALAAGIIVNGLPLMTEDGSLGWGVEDLDAYYEACVIGGPGAFVIPVLDWDDFPMAVRRKLVLELVGPPEVVFVRSGRTADGYDCQIGEKLRRERELIFNEP